MRICFVCLGNICRSPAAEAVLVHLLDQEYADRNLGDLVIESAGTADYHVGRPPHEQSVAEAARRRVPIEHQGRQFGSGDFAAYDLVIALDAQNEADLLDLAPDEESAAKVVRLGAFAPDVTEEGVRDVDDPWGHPDAAYVSMYDHLTDLLRGLLDHLAEGTTEEVLATHGGRRSLQ